MEYFNSISVSETKKISQDVTSADTELNIMIYFSVCLGWSLMALSRTGDIIGVILNHILHKDDVDKDDDHLCNKNMKFKDIMMLMGKIRREAKVFVRYPNVNRIMEIKVVSVNDAYRNQGVWKALVNKTK